ncbi:MAG: ABC transporter ATP-binding protein [Gammaproteobacteria bacterium]
MSDSPLLQVRDLERYYGNLHAVRGVSFDVSRGEILGFLGPNGAGKSTTMQILAGVLSASKGEVSVDGINLASDASAAKARIGYLPERPPLYVDMSVDEFLRFAARLRGVEGSQLSDSVANAKERCGLATFGRRIIKNLSKGYQQRVGIAQAIVHRPDLIILDEPSSGLDPNQIREIRALIRDLGEGQSVLLSTHILAEVQTLCDRVVIIDQGQIVHDEMVSPDGRDDARTHTVRVRQPFPTDIAVALEGVEAVSAQNDLTYLVRHDGRTSTTDALVKLSVSCGLVEFVPSASSLEDLFVALTLGKTDHAKPDDVPSQDNRRDGATC